MKFIQNKCFFDYFFFETVFFFQMIASQLCTWLKHSSHMVKVSGLILARNSQLTQMYKQVPGYAWSQRMKGARWILTTSPSSVPAGQGQYGHNTISRICTTAYTGHVYAQL